MKKLFLFAATVMLAACSSDSVKVNDSQQQAQLEPGAIGFDVYTQKSTTRGGVTGALTTAELLQYTPTQSEFNKAGFGVFGYYTDNNEYDQRSVPNFMYNQQVTYGAAGWTYEPTMYWPNEYGDNAKSDDSDKLTFFAYAPYIEVVPTSGKLSGTTPEVVKELEQWGITGMTRNSNQGDPILKYIASFDADKSVDLCWGVADNNDGLNWNITQTGVAQTSPSPIDNGMPWIDVQRPANTGQRVKFTFKHATAQMQVKIDADVDVDGRGHLTPVADKTRIWVRSVTFKGFAMKGSLNLNNDDANKAKWLDYNGQNELVAEDVVIYDGRKDGKEGVNGSVATNEKTVGLNPTLVQDGVYQNVTDGKNVYNDTQIKVIGTDGTTERKGVTSTPVNLFDNGSLFHVIPVDNETFEVEIVYDIETVDGNLAQNLSDGQTKGSSIENRITKKVTFGTDENLHTGHSYKLNLHLGLNSVKFDAEVTDWIEEGTQDIDLPLNIPAFTAGSPLLAKDIPLPFKGDYSFAIIGLDGGESVGTFSTAAAEASDEITASEIEVTTGYAKWSFEKNAANTSGMAIQKVTTAVNPTTKDRTQLIAWKGAQSGKGVALTFNQKAHPLFMTITKMVNNGSNQGEITLTRWNDETHQSSSDWAKTGGAGYYEDGWLSSKTGSSAPAVLEVWRNGIKLDASTVSFDDSGTETSNTITIGDKLQNGDVIKVVLTTGDAPTETVTAVFEGMSFSPSVLEIPYRAKNSGEYADDYALPVVKNFYTSVTYGSSNNAIATVHNTSGAITIKDVGEVTITATDAATNTATYKLKVTPQNTSIDDSEVIKTKSVAWTSGGTITSFSTAKIKGDIDADVNGDITYTITGAKFNGASLSNYNTYLQIVGNDLKFTSASFGATTVVITVNAEGTVTEDAKYKKPGDKTIEITWTP